VDHQGTGEQAEQLRVIGTRLKDERQTQSVSLEEIAAKTYIPLRLLNAIENARMDILPEPVFIQGFIRRYADVLGLDGIAISKEFTVNLSPLPESVPSLTTSSEPSQVSGIAPARSESDRSFQPPQLPQFQLPNLGEGRRSYLPIAGIGAVLVLGLIAIMAYSANRPKTATTPTQPAKVVAPTTPTNSQSTQPAKPSPVPTVAAKPSGVGVRMSVNEESWVQVIVDGEQAFEGTLPKGTQRTWTGKKEVEITAGNAGGVTVSYNNAPFKPMGPAGGVQIARFPPTTP
jgi:cytoskeletal protein RodZ